MKSTVFSPYVDRLMGLEKRYALCAARSRENGVKDLASRAGQRDEKSKAGL